MSRVSTGVALSVCAALLAVTGSAFADDSVTVGTQPVTNEKNIISVQTLPDGRTITTSESDTVALPPTAPRALTFDSIYGDDTTDVALNYTDPSVVFAARGRYGCYSKRISHVETSLTFYQWGLTLDKQWCGYVQGRVTSQDKQTYVSTGTCWNQSKPYYSDTQKYSSGHYNTYSHAYFKYSCNPVYSQEEDGLVGIKFYGGGSNTTYSN